MARIVYLPRNLPVPGVAVALAVGATTGFPLPAACMCERSFPVTRPKRAKPRRVHSSGGNQ
jgi:hypothetical protein